MAAIQVYAYGGADQLTLGRIPRPEPGDGEALVRVRAAGVNPIDWKLREGVRRDVMPMRFPYVPGVDLAGVVEQVGPGVTTVRPGQEVFGRGAHGSYAEYALAPAQALASKPTTVGFDEAAAIPLGATTAWQGLFEQGHLEPGQRVLILGGAGGVGLFAVQFARWKGAEVIATASARNADFVRSLGAQTVIDYTTTPVADAARDVDLVFDTVGGAALAGVWPALKRAAPLVSIAGQADEAQARERDVRTARFSAQISGDLLGAFARLIDEGQVTVTVGATFPLGEARQAQELSQGGHGRGRIILPGFLPQGFVGQVE